MNVKEYENKPKEVNIEVTTACNSNCGFCYNKNSFAKTIRGKNYLEKHEIKKIIDKISEAGISRVRFTGGEPLLRPDIFELANYAKDKGIITVLNTNGTLVNTEIAKKITDSIDICLVSFFSSNSKYVDDVTGIKGTYEKKIIALELLQDCKELWCSTVIAEPNIHEDLENIYQILKKYNVNYWFLLRVNPTPNNKNPHTFNQIEDLVEAIIEFKNKYGLTINIGNPLPFCSYKPTLLKEIVDDGVLHAEAKSKMVVNPFGDIVVDSCIDIKVGNALEDNLLDCWQTGLLRKLRLGEYLPQTCKKCKLVDTCLGGSRFAAKVSYGAFNEMDPLARPHLYKDELFND